VLVVETLVVDVLVVDELNVVDVVDVVEVVGAGAPRLVIITLSNAALQLYVATPMYPVENEESRVSMVYW
jgi:hypothetical protein